MEKFLLRNVEVPNSYEIDVYIERGGYQALAKGSGPLYTLLSNKYYIDELYMAVVVNPLKGLAGWLAQAFDAQGIDGLVNGLAAFFGWSGQITRQVQTGSVRHYALSILLGVVVMVGYFVLR